MSEERFSLKDHLFNHETVGRLADWMEGVDPAFDRARFLDSVLTAMPELELKQRITLISDVLAAHLPDDFQSAAVVIENALPPPLDPTLGDDDFGEFIVAPFGDYVARHGLAPEDYQTSMALLKELTMRFSMEGSIRPFLVEYPDETMAVLEAWATDDNYHVRRLVSEGTRPRLPWAARIPIEIDRPIPLLDQLHADATRYVTRSVANHINDIAKIDQALAIQTLARWHRAGRQEPPELSWMTKHALRTLIKQGDPDAMKLLGYSTSPKVDVEVSLPAEARIGDVLAFGVTLTSERSEPLLVDYVIDFVKKNGSTSPRVFKLKQIEMNAGESRTITKRHRLPASATTFTLYPGTHRLSVMVNGNVFVGDEFELAPA